MILEILMMKKIYKVLKIGYMIGKEFFKSSIFNYSMPTLFQQYSQFILAFGFNSFVFQEYFFVMLLFLLQILTPLFCKVAYVSVLIINII